MFSLDYGEIYEGEKNVELGTGFCCVFNCEASRKFRREWRSKVDATGAQGSYDQLQVNQMYKTWTASQKIRTVRTASWLLSHPLHRRRPAHSTPAAPAPALPRVRAEES